MRMIMVLRANRNDSGLGGHIASFASAATLYDVGFNHFWHAPQIPMAAIWCSRKGIHHPASMRAPFCSGRLTEDQMDNFRREVDGKGFVQLSAPVADAGLLAVPHGVDGTWHPCRRFITRAS
jgi:pyruvate dehydrogenase E1 component